MLLDNLLDATEVTVEPFAICEVADGVELDLGAQTMPTIHYLLQGGARIDFGKGHHLTLPQGSVAIIPSGWRQSMVGCWNGEANPCAPAARTPLHHDTRLTCCHDLDPAWKHHLAEGSPSGDPLTEAPRTIMACSQLHASYCVGSGLFDYLDQPIVAVATPGDSLTETLNRLLEELAAPSPGSLASARLLLKQCLILVLRRHCSDGDCRLPWLAALEDERLAKALQAMIDDPAEAHDLDSLAARAGMSRSSFAQHFAGAFGRGAIDLLIELRLKSAARLLGASNLPITRVAQKTGYRSRSYFTRAFQARFGLSPGAFRKQARQRETPATRP